MRCVWLGWSSQTEWLAGKITVLFFKIKHMKVDAFECLSYLSLYNNCRMFPQKHEATKSCCWMSVQVIHIYATERAQACVRHFVATISSQGQILLWRRRLWWMLSAIRSKLTHFMHTSVSPAFICLPAVICHSLTVFVFAWAYWDDDGNSR